MKITLRQTNLRGAGFREIQVQHGDYAAVRGKLFTDIQTLPHCTYYCYWCGYVNSRFTLRTDWRTYRQLQLDAILDMESKV